MSIIDYVNIPYALPIFTSKRYTDNGWACCPSGAVANPTCPHRITSPRLMADRDRTTMRICVSTTRTCVSRLRLWPAASSAADNGSGSPQPPGGTSERHAPAVPTDLTHRCLDGQIGIAQQTRQPLGTQRRQVRHRCLPIGIHEHAAELRRRQVHRGSQLSECPSLFGCIAKQIDGLSCLGAQRRELMKSRWTRVAGGLPLGRRATNRGGPHIGSDHVEHSEQQRLKSVAPVRRRPIELEGDELVEP